MAVVKTEWNLELTENNLVIKGNFCKIFGDNCVVHGSYCEIYGKNAVIKGNNNIVYKNRPIKDDGVNTKIILENGNVITQNCIENDTFVKMVVDG